MRAGGWMAMGAGAAVGGRTLVGRLLLGRFRRDLAALNAGDHEPLLSRYADDAVLRFNAGPHRWSGDHRGRDAIDRFLRDFVHAGVRGEIGAIWMAGPPWALRLAARFDDGVVTADGEELYANRTVVVLRTSWGRVVEHEDFWVDTSRIAELEERLVARGVLPL